MFSRCFLLFFALLFVLRPSLAGPGKIIGHILAADSKKPVVANVIVEGTGRGASSDSSGYYYILDVPPGMHNVRASAVGYIHEVISGIRVSPDETVLVEFALHAESVDLAEIVVEGKLPRVEKSRTSAKTTFESGEVRGLPIASFDDLIATSAGVFRTFIRGSQTFESKVFVDGVDVTNQYAGWYADAQGMTPYLYYAGVTRVSEGSTPAIVTPSFESVQQVNLLAGAAPADYNSGSGIISYWLKEGRGSWTGRAHLRFSQLGGLKHVGPGIYNDADAYLKERTRLAASANPQNRAKADRFTWSPGKYSYGVKPEIVAEFGVGGSLFEETGIYVTGRWFDSHGSLPNEFTRRASGSIKLNSSLSSSLRLSILGMLEDRGRLLCWKNRAYADLYRFFLEGVPKWDGISTLGSLKLTHVISASTFYEVQASVTHDNTRRGFCDDNNDGIIQPYENGDFLTWEDTAQVNRYQATNVGGEWNKFFVGYSYFGEDGSLFNTSPYAKWKLNRPSIYYENFVHTSLTLRVDVSSQINKNHQIGAGVQAKLHMLDKTLRTGAGTTGYDEEMWTRYPKEYGGYLQDKMEFEGLILNAGLRVDAFDVNAADVADWFAPTGGAVAAGGQPGSRPVRGPDAPIRLYVSPRFGVSHPISDNAAMYFSLARTISPRPFSLLYTNYNNYLLGWPILHVDQEPLITTTCDFGLQWSFAPGLTTSAAIYFKESQNCFLDYFVVIPISPGSPNYRAVTSNSFAQSRGIELTLEQQPIGVASFLRLAGRATYTFSYVKGCGTIPGNPRTLSASQSDSLGIGGQVPFDDITYWRRTYVNWGGGPSTMLLGGDRRHKFSASLAMEFPLGIRLGAVGRFASGFFYTTEFNTSAELANFVEGPWNKRIDIRLEKGFPLWKGAEAALYVDLINAFNWVNVLGFNAINEDTYRPWVDSWDPTGGPLLNRVVTSEGTLVYDVPREVYFGLSFSF